MDVSRQELRGLLDQRREFRAHFVQTGQQGNRLTALLLDLRFPDQKHLLADHVWVPLTRGLRGMRLVAGDRIDFSAVVVHYTRGDGTRDYGLGYLRDVRIARADQPELTEAIAGPARLSEAEIVRRLNSIQYGHTLPEEKIWDKLGALPHDTEQADRWLRWANDERRAILAEHPGGPGQNMPFKLGRLRRVNERIREINITRNCLVNPHLLEIDPEVSGQDRRREFTTAILGEEPTATALLRFALDLIHELATDLNGEAGIPVGESIGKQRLYVLGYARRLVREEDSH